MNTHALRRILALLSLSLVVSLAPAQTPAPTAPGSASPSHVDASAGAEKKDASGKFQRLHQSFLQRGKAGPIGVLFLGDSITEGWVRAPHIWEHFYGELQPANFGIGGDQTQHVIWRIEQGELDGIQPKVVVLMIGTNNTAGNSGEEIAAADKKIVEMIRAKLPSTKVLLLAIFPRGARKNKDGVVTDAAIADATKRMAAIYTANAAIAKLDDGQNVRFLNINDRFLGQDGRIPFTIMPDQLHPNAAGYELWAEAMQPLLKEMLKPAATP